MKRFTDTELWDKGWFMALKPKHKLLVRFLFDKCDGAGVWTPNWTLAAIYIGEPVDLEDLQFLGTQVETMDNGKVFLPGFIEFQYGQLSQNCKPHLKIFSLLKKHNLYERICIGYTKGIKTLEEEEEDKEEEKEKEFGKSENLSKASRASSRRPNIPPPREKDHGLRARYESLIETVKVMLDTKEMKKALAEFITAEKPLFIQPYADLWNLSAQSTGVPQLSDISEGRIKKFKTRIREPAFDFLKVLEEIKISNYLQGKTNDWKVDWDWIFENDTHYLKIIEGKYRKPTN